MKKIIISLMAILCTMGCYSQPAQQETANLLLGYQYNTQNNLINFEKEFTENFSPLLLTNVYFRYYKNQNFLGAPLASNSQLNASTAPAQLIKEAYKKNKVMLFTIQYDFLVQTIVKSNDQLNFQFRINKSNDKIDKIKVTYYRRENGSVVEGKLSKKEFEATIDQNMITIKPKKKALHENDVLRVWISIESPDVNLKDLSSLNKLEGVDHFITLNIPEIFQYNIKNDHLDLLKVEEIEMRLIRFYFDVNAQKLLDNYPISSKTYFYVVKEDSRNVEIMIPLNSVDLPLDIGIDEEELFNRGKGK